MPQFDDIYTYENIQKRKMSVVSDELDKREGSVIWTTVAANSMEMALAYAQMKINQQNAFPDTANREYLIRHCALRGITPYPATSSIVQGKFQSDTTTNKSFNPSEGTEFTLQNTKLVFKVKSKISDGNWSLECQTPGSIGNVKEGVLVPVREIQSLGKAEIVGLLQDGDEEEETEALRKRYMESLKAQSFAGNKAAYKEMCNGINGVGATKVYRAFNGQTTQAGHVGLCILNEDLGVPSQELVTEVQEIIDPKKDGEGTGMAPLDHIVHVFPATEQVISVNVKIRPSDQYVEWDDISQSVTNAIQMYFNDLKNTWDSEDKLMIKQPKIVEKLLGVDAIFDVTECMVKMGYKNDTSDTFAVKNIQLESMKIPKVGDVNGEIVQSD